MRIRLADYVADFLASHKITDVFSVVGGGAMHLNDALGHHEGLHVTYNHHEQACAIAAEAYARLENRIAAVCVTTGPGGTNALTGVLGGWLDSIPMFIISGQVRYDTTARYALQYTETPLRAMGDQEYDIVKSVAPMTKYAVMLENPLEIRHYLEKAWHLATTGRPGPVWIDIPVNFQGMYIETDELLPYLMEEMEEDDKMLPPPVSEDVIRSVIEKIRAAKRPVFHAGYGIRLSGAYDVFRQVVEQLNIPVVTYWNAVDLIEDSHPLYTGRAGNMGDRPGNWAIQNADLILAVGTRISIRQVGYNWKTWAREAEVIMVDVDPAELKKPTLHVEMPVWADAKDFLTKLHDMLTENKITGDLNQNGLHNEFTSKIGAELCKQDAKARTNEEKSLNLEGFDKVSSVAEGLCKETQQDENTCQGLFHGLDWLTACARWKKEYPVVLPKHWEEKEGTANVYAFIRYLSSKLPDNSLTAVSNGACCVVGNQAYVIGKGSRMANNSAVASMGYGLPAAIGTCISGKHLMQGINGDASKSASEEIGETGRTEFPPTICLEGDGSIMMNLQELQTVITNRLPIKVFLINNNGYHSIRITQNNLFHEHCKVGIGPESGDLSFPNFENIAKAFGFPYYCARSNREMMDLVDRVVSYSEFCREEGTSEAREGDGYYGPIFCEIFTDTSQVWEPKSSTKRLEDGSLVSPPLEDLAPFLPREELAQQMFIPLLDEV